jgi:uncharacterized tellurite resistance protein B-like protein
LEMDFSESSMALTDEAISKFHPDGAALDTTIVAYGAYVGEVIRRNLGGVWQQDERGVAILKNIGGVDITALPFSWTRKRFDNGMEDSLAYKYSFIKSEVAKSGVAVSPEPVRIPAAERDPLAGPEVDRLARSPLLVFLIVAAADGKVDKKEMVAFHKVMSDGEVCGSRMLRTLYEKVTVPNIETFLQELTGGQIDPLTELKSVGAVLDEHYPDQAEMFKESLVDIARQIADASGGIFGFGKKMDKDEANAILAIAIALGVLERRTEAPAASAGTNDLELLGRAPVMVAIMVASADGDVDKKEILAFRDTLEKTFACPSVLLKQALETVTLPQLHEIIAEACVEGYDHLDMLRQTAAMLDAKYPQEALLCKTLLVAIARKVAEASGGFLGFGKKVGAEELQCIAEISEALGLPKAD